VADKEGRIHTPYMSTMRTEYIMDRIIGERGVEVSTFVCINDNP
jgi:hypothetical protein